MAALKSNGSEAVAKRSFSGGADSAGPNTKKRKQDRDGGATAQFIEVLKLADVYDAGSSHVAVRGGALAHFPASGNVGSSSSSFSSLVDNCFRETLNLLPEDREKFAAEDSEFFAVTKHGDGAAAQLELHVGSVQLADPIATGQRRDKGRANGGGGRMLPAGAPRICTSQTQTITTTRQALVQGYMADGKSPVLLSCDEVRCY